MQQGEGVVRKLYCLVMRGQLTAVGGSGFKLWHVWGVFSGGEENYGNDLIPEAGGQRAEVGI